MRNPGSSYTFVFVLFAAVLASMAFCSPLNAQPDLIHLSLGAKKSREVTSPVTVTWCNEQASGSQFVKYGLTPETGNSFKAREHDFNNRFVFSVTLKKLKGGTKYYYRCGSDADGWSQLYSFNSEPDSGSFRVGVIGDTQNNTNNENYRKTKVITDLVQIYSPSFTLHMGDIVDNGSVASNWSGLLSTTQELNARSPLMPVLGNHDVQNKKTGDFQKPFQDYLNLFNLPGDEINYSFTYMNVRFIGIFSGCAEAAAASGQVKYTPGSPEYKWLDAELSKAEKDKRIKWTVVWMHYPLHSFGWSYIADWNKNVSPLIEKHHVDLCLAGHRHIYERHFQKKDGVPVKNNPDSKYFADNGTVYITNGTAGGNPTGLGGKDMVSMAFTPGRIMYSFSIMDIDDKSITYRNFDKNNLLIDWFTIIR